MVGRIKVVSGFQFKTEKIKPKERLLFSSDLTIEVQKRIELEHIMTNAKDKLEHLDNDPEQFLRDLMLDGDELETVCHALTFILNNQDDQYYDEQWQLLEKFDSFELVLYTKTLDIEGPVIGEYSLYSVFPKHLNQLQFPKLHFFELNVNYVPYDEFAGAGYIIPIRPLSFGDLLAMSGPGKPLNISQVYSYSKIIEKNSFKFED